ncbi:ABC transporter ATP-binding protein [Filifactor villosus]|uniref:ABC transporter ATP-binding protein n=1 Tax=Filifactor villosus TaxID=29374 RepID=A0ABV9QJ62_9FIRM
MSSVLSLKNVTKRFGGLTAVDTVNFEIQQGEIYGLIGPNGAGKTTIFNLITGVYDITEGEIKFHDKVLNGKKPFQIAELGVTRTFQNIRLFKKLTTYDNVLTACHRSANYGFFDTLVRNKKFRAQEKELREKTRSLLELMGLWEYRDMVSSNLPYGLQRKLEIARALALDPALLLLDEPAAGMNPEETISLMELIREIRDRFNLTVLVIEHHMDLIMGVCDRIYVLNFGKPLAEGTPEQIQNDPHVVEAYLGKVDDEHDA